MGLTDLPLLSMLRTRMQWSQERQRVLAENIANSDTPNYRARDLVAPKFEPGEPQQPGVTNVALLRTEDGHIGGDAPTDPSFRSLKVGNYEVRPTGNAVNLEDEMMKVAANSMDYQAVSALYTRSLDLFKIAMGKR